LLCKLFIGFNTDSFVWKIAFLVRCWKQIIISRSWNWTHLQFSTQCSNGCQCVLCDFQWFLFSIMSVTVLYLGGGALFSRHSVYTDSVLTFMFFPSGRQFRGSILIATRSLHRQIRNVMLSETNIICMWQSYIRGRIKHCKNSKPNAIKSQ